MGNACATRVPMRDERGKCELEKSRSSEWLMSSCKCEPRLASSGGLRPVSACGWTNSALKAISMSIQSPNDTADMAMRVSYGIRDGELDVQRRSQHGVRQIAKPPCTSVDQAIDTIKADIKAAEEREDPGCTISEVTIGYEAIVELHRPNIGPYSEGGAQDLPPTFKTGWTAGGLDDASGGQGYPTANVDAITGHGDKTARAVVQRAASRAIVAAIEAADGFKYSMNNAWSAKDADGQRFSYICQDSMQNKDRHANGFTRTLKHLKSEQERGPRKPTYDCKGSVSIKCSMIRRTVDIFYRHYAIHSSVAERKAAPPKPRIAAEVGHGASDKPAESGGLLGRLRNEESAFAPSPTPGSASQDGSNIGRPLKRKRNEDTPSRPGKPLSLFELLKQSEAQEKKKSPTSEKPSQTPTSTHPPPINYDLPSWQAPPPPAPAPQAPPPPKAPAVQQHIEGYPRYQPPYQPSASQQYPYSRPQPPQHTPTSTRPRQKPNQHDPGYYGLTPAASNNANTSTPTSSPATGTPLFTTMKASYPFRMETPSSLNAGRTRSSCTNCRYGKRKCDETRPVCSACARAGKFDCAYDGAYGYPASAGQQAGMSAWVAEPASGYSTQKDHPAFVPQKGQGRQRFATPVQGQGGESVPDLSQYAQGSGSGGGGGQRDESPDPWFPKR